MFKNAVNVKQSIYSRVTQVTDQLFEFRLYTAYSRVLVGAWRNSLNFLHGGLLDITLIAPLSKKSFKSLFLKNYFVENENNDGHSRTYGRCCFPSCS